MIPCLLDKAPRAHHQADHLRLGLQPPLSLKCKGLLDVEQHCWPAVLRTVPEKVAGACGDGQSRGRSPPQRQCANTPVLYS